MAVDRELRLLLQHAHLPESDDGVRHPQQQPVKRVAARAIFDKLTTAWQQPLLPLEADGVNLAEILVLLAEAAIHQRDFATAQRAVDWFLHDCNAKNQFYCRAQFARAHCASQDAAADTGALRLQKVLDAIRFVLLVLPIACDARKRPQYDFLVYNASVTYWQIARQLMKPATFQFLAPSLTKIIEALRSVGERDVLWVATLQLTLVSAQLDAKQFANAAKTVNDLVDVQLAPLLLASGGSSDPGNAASSDQVRALYDAALRAQVHVGSMKDVECQKIVPNVKKIVAASTTSKRASLLVKLQCLKSGNIDKPVDAAYTEIIQEATGFAAFSLTSSPNTSDEELMNAFLHSLDAKSIDVIDADVIVETGLHAAFSHAHDHDELRVAHCCDVVLQRKGKSLAPHFRVLHQVLKAVLLVVSPLTSHHGIKRFLDTIERQSVILVRRMEAIKVLERALLAAKRQEDPNLVESVCVYAWNVALPLLQPHLRGQLSRVLTLSASLLEEMDSLLLVLRARLHLEISKVEIKSEFLSKAYESVNKALVLDYGASIAPAATIDEVLAQEQKITTRPVDPHLVPLKKKLQWKLDIEDQVDPAGSPQTAEKHIRALIESAKETKDTGDGLRAMLRQAAELLAAQVAADGLPENVSPPRLESLAVLWVDVCKMAWEKLKDGAMAEQLAKQGLDVFFISASATHDSESPLRVDKSLRVLEIDFRTVLTEILAAHIKNRALQLDTAKNQQQHIGKATRLGTRSKAMERKEKPASEIELSALKLLSEDTFVLGMHQPHVNVQAVSNGEEAGDAEAIQSHAKTIEDQVLGMKKEIVQHLVASLTVAGQIGWRFVLENTCVYLWNYHFQLFRMLATKSSHSFNVQLILPECTAAFEAAYAALEAFPERDGELLACNALGLSSIYEAMARWDKVLVIADTFLKRKASSIAVGHGAVSSIHLMRFAELKTRAQLSQNAKEISPGEIASPFLKVVAYLEALEMSFQQQPQSVDKCQTYYQKALTLWQSIAGEWIAALTTTENNNNDVPSQTLEKVQQQTEIYVELWTRVAYGALRLQQFRFVVECANQALEVLPLSSSLSDAAVLLTTSAWRWLAASEILCGRAILALGNGDKTSKMLVLGSLRHLVHAAEYANRARASSLVVKASEVVWNVSLMVLNNMNSTPEAKEYEPTDVKHVIGMLRTVLQFLSKAEAPCYGDLVLLTLALCEKAGEWVESCAVCEDALTAAASGGATRLLSIKTLNEISTASAISAAKLGKTSGGSGGGVSVKPGGVAGVGSRSAEQQDPLLKAKILKKIAFSSMKDPPAQLKALSSAYTELDGRPEEQAVLLIDMAEWFFTSRVSSQDAEMYLDNAARVLLASEALKANPFVTRNSSRTGISGGGGGLQAGSTSVTTSKREEADIPVYSALWMNEKLIRVFVMRAMTATSCSDRWGFIEKAAHCVDRAWQSIVAIINEMELQEVFGKVAAGATPSDLDFDEWKCSQKLKYSVPRSSQEWLEFYLQYAKSTDARFYMEWTNKLQVIQNSATATSVLHFTDPVLTGFYLEKLLTLLQEDMADELLLPTVCLYQVLYFGYSATKTRIMELWLELTLFNILERHNLAACALPLQSALEIFQMHGKLFVEELQTQGGASSGSSVGYVSKGVCRPVLESTSVNLRVKMASSIELLLRFGYVRQGKTGLEIMKHTLRDADNNRASQSEISILSALVHEIEGNANVALGEIEAALQNPSLDLQKFVRWTIHYCELSSDSAKQLKLLKDAEKLVASWLISTASEGGSGGGELGRVGELDVFLWIAQLKFKQATMSLRISPKRSGDESQSDDADDAQSRQVFSECIQILTHVDAKAQLSRFLVQYSQELLKQCAVAGNRISRSDVAHAVKSNLQRAISEMTAVRLCMNEFYERRASASTDGVDAPSAQVATTTVLGIEIALAKSLLASVELTCELSADVVTAHEITWYAYEADSKRNIVEKWLCQTSKELQQVDGGNLGAAIVLATAANTILSSMGGLEEHTAMTAAQVLQCRRLALYHHEDKMRTKKYIHKIWTRFTSSDSPHATWVCCGNSTSSATSGGQLATESSVALVTAAEAQENDHMDAFLSDFVHQMQQFQKLALEKRRPELLRVCSLELMQVYGCQRPLECIRSLLLYQSITASVHMRETFQRSVAPRDGQQLHLRRLERLQEMHVNASKHSLPYQLSLLYLEQQSAVFKRMSVTVPTETILASLPPHVRILSLQFSPDKCFLYCALVASGEKQYAMARMECTEPVMVLLTQTQERVRRWRSASAKLLTEFEELHAGEADFEFASTDSLAAQSLSSENDELEKEFSGIIVDTIDFLAPLFGHSALQSVLHSEIHGAAVTLLLDRDLECLPVEALPVLEKADCIARDFSLHVLYQRLQTQKAQPFKRDDMRFIVDPYHDDTGLDAQTMETVLHQHVKRPGATFSSWKDAVEHGQPPTTTDWQHALLNRRGGGLFYLGANRILGSSLSMSDLLGMSTALNCHVVCLLDRADNQASARRQSKVDSEKQSWQLAVEEDAYANAMLWSLAGVNVLVMNQYATTFNGNRRLANGLFAGLAKGFSIGKALKKYGELVSPSGAMNTAPPSTASSTVSSSTSLPPANSGSAAGSNTSSTAGIPAADTESTNSSNTKLHNAGSRSMSEAVVVPPATVAGTKSKQRLKHRLRYNTVVYGLAHVALKSAEQ